MKKKQLLLLLGLITIVWNAFSSEYKDERNISDVVVIQNTEQKCFILYKTDDSEVNMYIENHSDKSDCGKINFFNEAENIKATSSLLKKSKDGREFICFIGTDSDTEDEEDKLFIFMTGADYSNFYSNVISFPKRDNVSLKDFVISNSNEITVLLSINDNILSKKINIESNNINDSYLFSGFKIDEIKIFTNTEMNNSFYGMFISNNEFYAYILNNENESLEKITTNQEFYYLFNNNNPICYVSNGHVFTKIIYSNEIELKTIAFSLEPDTIRDVFETNNKIEIIARDEENIYSITIDIDLNSIQKQILCSNKLTPFIYIEKNKIFNNSIIMIIKDIGIYSYSNDSWLILDDYKNINPFLNLELSEISKDKEKDFEIGIDRNYKNGLFQYVAKIQDLKTFPLYETDEEKFDVIKNTSCINGLFYTFIKKSENIKIISKVD